MRKKAEDFLRIITVAYLLLILVVLPLYMKKGFVMIGDAKYTFFFRLSLLLAAASAAGAAVYGICGLCGRAADCGTNGRAAGCGTNGRAADCGTNGRAADCGTNGRALVRRIHGKLSAGNEKHQPTADCRLRWSAVDWCAAIFGVSAICSWIFSSYRETAFWGYPDWHMGVLTQLLLVWSYFLVTRWYDGNEKLWLLAGGAVFLIGVLNRFGLDPLGVFRGMSIWDWNRKNLLSTIGNINWYCGYVCTALPVSVYFYWRERGWRRAAAGAIFCAGLVSLVTQGSDSGLVALAAILLVLFWRSLANRSCLLRFFQTAVWIPGSCLAVTLLMRLFPIGLFIPEDSSGLAVLYWKGWPVIFAALLIGMAALGIRESRNSRDILRETMLPRIVRALTAAIILFGLAGFMLCQVSDGFWRALGSRSILRLDDAWGSGRGALWRLGAAGAFSGGPKQIFLGAGPDCFAPYIYERYDVAAAMQVRSGQWQDAIFANAHNEWLNMLVTQGFLGALSYAGIFLTAFCRCMRYAGEKPVLLIGAMSIIAYAANNFFSFQQIVAVPVMFALLAMSEGICRITVNTDSA